MHLFIAFSYNRSFFFDIPMDLFIALKRGYWKSLDLVSRKWVNSPIKLSYPRHFPKALKTVVSSKQSNCCWEGFDLINVHVYDLWYFYSCLY